MAKPFLDGCVVAVHDSPHHADDVFCVASVKLINPNVTIIRTRDEEELSKADFRIDVGGKYNPETGDYDHHQSGFVLTHKSPNENKIEKGPKLAGFGLIWKHYYKEIIDGASKIIKENNPNTTYAFTDEVIEYLRENIENTLVASVDAIDNGQKKEYYLDSGYFQMPTVIKFIQNYNPSPWVEDEHELDPEFYFNKAVELAINYLIREVIKQYGIWKVTPIVLEKVKQCLDGYLILDTYLPWGPVFSQHPEETKDIKMVIYPKSKNEYMFQSPFIKYSVDKDRFRLDLPNGKKREQRYLIPTILRGKSTSEIKLITGIDGVKFVHTSGFIGSGYTLEAALSISQYIVSNQEY